MSDQQSGNPSKLSKNSADIRLYERVRLHSFQSLLHGSPGRLRSPGKHPRVLLEDLLKAEVLSSQLVLAIEDLVKSLQGMLHTGPENGEDYGLSSTTEDESIKSFRSALAQSANTLDELTKLQISENSSKDVKIMDARNIENASLFVNTASIIHKHGTTEEEENLDQHRLTKILSYGSASTTPGEKSSSFSARGSEFSSTSPSDITPCEEEGMSGGEEGRRNGEGDVTHLHEAVKTLRNEIYELQVKHEVQFMSFASKIMEFEQDDHHNMRKILERIMQKLSPQDQNWTFHGRLDEAEMEQLFYFVLLQKTLRSCLAVMDRVQLREFDKKIENEEDIQLGENKETEGKRGLIRPFSNVNNEFCARCCRLMMGDDVVSGKTNENCQTCAQNRTPLDAPKNDNQYNSSDSNEEPHANGSCLSHKRPHDFEDEHENKKRKKGKSLFACFSAKWPRRNKRSKNKQGKNCNK